MSKVFWIFGAHSDVCSIGTNTALVASSQIISSVWWYTIVTAQKRRKHIALLRPWCWTSAVNRRYLGGVSLFSDKSLLSYYTVSVNQHRIVISCSCSFLHSLKYQLTTNLNTLIFILLNVFLRI